MKKVRGSELCVLQELSQEKEAAEAQIAEIAEDIASDLGLIMDKTVRLEWCKTASTRTRCMRITQACHLHLI